MKNHSSSRAQKGKTSYRTPHTWIADRPEILKKKNSSMFFGIKANKKKNHSYPDFFTQS